MSSLAFVGTVYQAPTAEALEVLPDVVVSVDAVGSITSVVPAGSMASKRLSSAESFSDTLTRGSGVAAPATAGPSSTSGSWAHSAARGGNSSSKRA